MQKHIDGGPAFCGAYDVILIDTTGQYPEHTIEARSRGMSLRDYFAGQALMGLLSSGIAADGNYQPEICARLSYEHADAMIKARQQPPNQE